MKKGPEWDSDAYQYAFAYLAPRVWQTKGEYDLDDLLQEAYIIYLTLVRKYGKMSKADLKHKWRTAVRRMLENLKTSAEVRRARMAEHLMGDGDLRVAWDGQTEAEWAMHLGEATPYVQKLVEAINARGRKPRARTRRGLDTRETTNEYLCRVAGIDPSIPLRDQLERFLGISPG